ncbi:hypothetical protein GQX74_012997, partial [Glossina fuscipes]
IEQIQQMLLLLERAREKELPEECKSKSLQVYVFACVIDHPWRCVWWDCGYKIVFSTHHCHVMKSVIELITLYSVFSRNDDDDGNKKRGCPQFQIQICEIKMGDTTTSTQY